MKWLLVMGFLSLYFPLCCMAQSYGCKLSNGRIYSPQTGVALLGATLVPLNLGVAVNLYSSPEIPNTPVCPGWAASVSSTGRKCATTAVSILGLGIVATNSGDEVSFNYVLCPIDDYSWLLVVSLASFALFKIRKRKD